MAGNFGLLPAVTLHSYFEQGRRCFVYLWQKKEKEAKENEERWQGKVERENGMANGECGI
jgi:hypothetical protein